MYQTDVGNLFGMCYDWQWTPEGHLARRIVGHFWVTSKTRKFQQSFFAQAVIEKREIFDCCCIDTDKLTELMRHKTENMECTFVTVLENSVGKGKNFPYSRGRFTVLKIENVNDEG